MTRGAAAATLPETELLCRELIKIDPADTVKKRQLLDQLFPSSKYLPEIAKPRICGPFHTTESSNVKLNGFIFANYCCHFEGDIEFGSGVLCGPVVRIFAFPEGHRLLTEKNRPYVRTCRNAAQSSDHNETLADSKCRSYRLTATQEATTQNPATHTSVKIGNNVWIGGGATIIEGIQIGDGTVVAAGSVVTEDLPENVVAAGRPCRVIKCLDTYQEVLKAPDPSDKRTQKQRMLNDESFYPEDAELKAERRFAQKLCYELISSDSSTESRKAKLKQLLPHVCIDDARITGPFYCDYGYRIHGGKGLIMGNNCCFLDIAVIQLGDNVRIGNGVQIYTVTHPLSVTERQKGYEQGFSVTIGDNVVIADETIILPGVAIGAGTVIRAGSIVTKNIPGDVIAGGVPCKIL